MPCTVSGAAEGQRVMGCTLWAGDGCNGVYSLGIGWGELRVTYAACPALLDDAEPRAPHVSPIRQAAQLRVSPPPQRAPCGRPNNHILIASQQSQRIKLLIWLCRRRRGRTRRHLRSGIRSTFDNASVIDDDPSRWLLVRHFPLLLFCRETQSKYYSLVVTGKGVAVAKFPFRVHHTRSHREAKVRDALHFPSKC